MSAAHFFIFVSLILVTNGAGNPGNPECPCYNPGAFAKQQLEMEGCLLAVFGFNIYCYNEDYGSSMCKAWDEGIEPDCSGPDPPAGCANEWCWVDPRNCSLQFKLLRRFATPTYFSTETCGSSGRVASSSLTNALRGTTIRIGFPETFERPYYFADPKGAVQNANGTTVTGAVVMLVLDVLSAAGINFTVNPVSPASKKLYPLSSFSACVHTVSMGYLDLCVGSFWETSERQAMVAMGNMIFVDNMVLVSLSVAEVDSFWELAARVFKPFSWQLWITIICVVIFLGLLVWINAAMSGQRVSARRALYLSLSVYCPNADSPNAAGRILFITIGFFVVLTTATYTAGLASYLVAQNSPKARLENLGDVMRGGYRLCILQAAEQQLLALEPGLGPLLVRVSSTTNAVAGVQTGQCEGAIISATHANRAARGAFGDCGIIAAPKIVFTLSDALPMQDTFVPPLGYWQRRALEAKPWEKYMEDFAENSVCPEADTGTSNAVQVNQMLGMWLVMAFMLLIWLLKVAIRAVGKHRGWTESDGHLKRFLAIDSSDEMREELPLEYNNSMFHVAQMSTQTDPRPSLAGCHESLPNYT